MRFVLCGPNDSLPSDWSMAVDTIPNLRVSVDSSHFLLASVAQKIKKKPMWAAPIWSQFLILTVVCDVYVCVFLSQPFLYVAPSCDSPLLCLH